MPTQGRMREEETEVNLSLLTEEGDTFDQTSMCWIEIS
jgi:hypothetical protein